MSEALYQSSLKSERNRKGRESAERDGKKKVRECSRVKGKKAEGRHIFHLDLTDCPTHFTLAISHGGAVVGLNRCSFDSRHTSTCALHIFFMKLIYASSPLLKHKFCICSHCQSVLGLALSLHMQQSGSSSGYISIHFWDHFHSMEWS